jgi:hypothetical protein
VTFVVAGRFEGNHIIRTIGDTPGEASRFMATDKELAELRKDDANTELTTNDYLQKISRPVRKNGMDALIAAIHEQTETFKVLVELLMEKPARKQA